LWWEERAEMRHLLEKGVIRHYRRLLTATLHAWADHAACARTQRAHFRAVMSRLGLRATYRTGEKCVGAWAERLRQRKRREGLLARGVKRREERVVAEAVSAWVRTVWLRQV
jgi:hypothetical protein